MATSRESELRELIARSADSHINAHRAETKAWVDELVKIEEHKTMPVFVTNTLPPGHHLLFAGEPAFGKDK